MNAFSFPQARMVLTFRCLAEKAFFAFLWSMVICSTFFSIWRYLTDQRMFAMSQEESTSFVHPLVILCPTEVISDDIFNEDQAPNITSVNQNNLGMNSSSKSTTLIENRLTGRLIQCQTISPPLAGSSKLEDKVIHEFESRDTILKFIFNSFKFI